jgi:hypothetical protein
MKTAVIAAIASAVVAAASGTAAMFVVTSKNIQNGTIQTVDISAKTRRALKGNRGPRGFVGLQGPEGRQGPQGIAGKTPAYSNAYSDRVAVPPGSFRFVNAICPAGTLLVGGGHATDRVSLARLVPTNFVPDRHA